MKRTSNYLLPGMLALVLSLAACKNEKTKSETKVTEIPVTSKSAEAKAAFAEGLTQGDDGNFIKARAAFTKAIGHDSTLAIAYLFRANNAQSPKDFMDDLAKAKNLLEGASDWEKIYYDYQNTYATNDWDKRLELVKQMAEKYPEAARAQVELGNVYQQGNKVDMEREAYKKAAEMAPKWVGGHTGLANSYLFSEPKDFKKGEEHALKVVELLPKSSNAQVLLGDAYRAQDDLEKARTAYAKAIEFEPDVATAYYKRGHINSFLGKYDDARLDYLEAAKRDDDNSTGMMNIGYTYLYAGDHAAAMKVFMDEAAKLDASAEAKSKTAGRKLNYLFVCAMTCLHYGDVEHLKEVVAMMQAPRDQITADIGSEEEKLISKGATLFWQAMINALEGNLDAAKAKAEEMKTTLEPVKSPTKLDDYEMVLGYISMKEKKYAEATTHFDKANQNSVYTNYWQAMALEAAGNKEKAMELFKKVSVYNFNGVDYAVIRNEVKKKVAGP